MSEALRKALERRRAQQAESKKAWAREALWALLEKRIRTAFIAPLASFEAAFGPLWGLGKDGPLSGEEQAWLAAWAACRTQALDKGNRQLRAARLELDGFDIFSPGQVLYPEAGPDHE